MSFRFSVLPKTRNDWAIYCKFVFIVIKSFSVIKSIFSFCKKLSRSLYIYIYIYIYRERERERGVCARAHEKMVCNKFTLKGNFMNILLK